MSILIYALLRTNIVLEVILFGLGNYNVKQQLLLYTFSDKQHIYLINQLKYNIMKKTITIIVLMTGFLGFGQMKISESAKTEIIGKVSPMGMLTAEVTRNENICTLTYKDNAYTQIDVFKSFSFRSTDTDTLYLLFTDFSNIKEGDVKNVDLDDGGKLNIEYKKSLGQIYASAIHIDKSGISALIPYMTKKQFSKLFGKS